MKNTTNSTKILAGFEQKIQELIQKIRELSEEAAKGTADGLEEGGWVG